MNEPFVKLPSGRIINRSLIFDCTELSDADPNDPDYTPHIECSLWITSANGDSLQLFNHDARALYSSLKPIAVYY